MFETISRNTLTDCFIKNYNKRFNATSHEYVGICLYNSNNMSISINTDYLSYSPFFQPIEIIIDKNTYVCFNYDFAKLILSLISDDAHDIENADNSFLLLLIAEYFSKTKFRNN